MAIPTHLHRKLQHTLGQEAAEGFVSWMDGVDHMRSDITDMRADIANFRHELQILSARMDARFAAMETLIERRTSDLMKWSFVFWVGAVTSIAILAKLLP